jgi:hypothetical protein
MVSSDLNLALGPQERHRIAAPLKLCNSATLLPTLQSTLVSGVVNKVYFFILIQFLYLNLKK